MWTAARLREAFLEYFERDDHVHWKSFSVLPDDNTLLFTNSGMVQFKKKFLDLADESSAYGQMKRACNYQKCIRAGGKHNDLDDVGKDTYHHTFFEMLGNWSFGDYFKEHAIELAWKFLTEVLQLDKDRLYVSYFEGQASTNLPADLETKQIWSKYLDTSRILPFGAKENFWEMGNSGPCGPCTEIHYDRVGGRDASALVNMDDPDVIEIWNVVFMEYNKNEKMELSLLPKKHIDTGMGLERVLSILQKESSNYNTDLFLPIFKQIETTLQIRPYTGLLTDKLDIAYRVVADHSRTLAIALMDGIMPSCDGRGYVIRRILRRALGFQYLHMKKTPGLLPELVRASFEYFNPIYPTETDIVKVVSVVKEEEDQFTKTLSVGLNILVELIEKTKATAKPILSGEDIFILYDRFGFPVDLTTAVAEREGVLVDHDGFLQRQKEAKELSRQGGAQSTGIQLSVHDISALEARDYPATDDGFKYAAEDLVCGRVLGIKIGTDLVALDELDKYADVPECGIVLDRTSFYSEAGGQEGDHGEIVLLSNPIEDSKSDEGFDLEKRTISLQIRQSVFQVKDTKRYGKYVLHIGVLKGQLRAHGLCRVNLKRRNRLAIAHTSTHLLNYVLLHTLPGDIGEPRQCGSLVSEGRLRFDFWWPHALSAAEITAIEDKLASILAKKEKVRAYHMPYDEAIKIKGLRFMKDEAYPQTVRVIMVGEKPMDEPHRSAELCGGTHVSNTAEIEKIRILAEAGIARGVRRIVALCGQSAKDAEHRAKTILSQGISNQQELQAIRNELETSDFPLKEAQQIRVQIESFQKAQIQKQKAYFEAEHQRLVQELEEKSHILFTCAPLADMPASMATKMLSPLVQHLDKNKKHGVILYPVDEGVLLYGVLPNASEVLKNAFKEDRVAKIGGKGVKAFGSTSYPLNQTIEVLKHSLSFL
ncbi:alanyl-tRNA synthetase [Nematocida homosporus]|uniref:alanyl-tRNA synthetase n=1 Tax=Nematocida homosporus TaxID=1912981 RepID=UPI0022209B9B|nr:alanyl-tRNA synthetase [Nematocida homosporus]KAI5185631.1 alanyl-tRNA synthetase [Nematocida homosporus]